MLFSAAEMPRQSEGLRRLANRYAARLERTSRALMAFLDLRMEMLIVAWIGAIVLLGAAKMAIAPRPPVSLADAVAMILPVLLIAGAPIAGYRIASGSFPRGLLSAQPVVRLCRYGQWRPLDLLEARRNPAFGPCGFMASLVFGILLNVPFRSLEYLLAVPPLGLHAPGWAHTLQWAMTADVAMMSFFYMVCFVMALRSVPLFPRMLLFAWILDITMQLTIAQRVSQATDLPPAVAEAMAALLEGNLQKVLISAAVWLPYLILSERVNVTFRHRASF